jgi:hypothetical protein
MEVGAPSAWTAGGSRSGARRRDCAPALRGRQRGLVDQGAMAGVVDGQSGHNVRPVTAKVAARVRPVLLG